MMNTDAIAPMLNSGVYGMILGNAIKPSAKITDKSTLPMKIATIYPTTKPTRTDNCLRYPFAKQFQPKHTSNVIVPKIRFCAEPKSSAYPPPKDLAPTVNRD
jgi:hypothetical protein